MCRCACGECRWWRKDPLTAAVRCCGSPGWAARSLSSVSHKGVSMRLGIAAIVGLVAAGLVVPRGVAQDSRRRVPMQRSGTSYLGLGALEVTPERAKALNLSEDRGVEVAHVEEDSPAAKAGV